MLAFASVITMLGAGLAVTTAASASAHVGAVSATCQGISINLTNFAPKDGYNANTVTVTINGTSKVTNRAFGQSYSQTIKFPNEYRPKGNSWTVSWTAWDDARFSGSRSGHEAACDIPDQPQPQVEHRDVTGQPDCTTGTVTTEHQSRTETFTFQYGQWVGTWGPWVTDSTTVEDVQPGQCGPGDQPQPKVEVTPWQDQSWPCGATTTTQTRTKTTTPYVLVNGTWVAGTPVVTTETQTRNLLPSEITTCPSPEKPQPIVVQSQKSNVDCSTKERTITTTTTTTDWVLNAAKTAWIKGTPVVTTTVSSVATTAQECPTTTPTPSPTVSGVKVTAPPKVAPTVKGVKHSAAAPAVAELAYTGSETTTYGLAGLALVLLGSTLVLVTRRRTTRG
jgi:LPXTG-motif cell wall-anchored protein